MHFICVHGRTVRTKFGCRTKQVGKKCRNSVRVERKGRHLSKEGRAVPRQIRGRGSPKVTLPERCQNRLPLSTLWRGTRHAHSPRQESSLALPMYRLQPFPRLPTPGDTCTFQNTTFRFVVKLGSWTVCALPLPLLTRHGMHQRASMSRMLLNHMSFSSGKSISPMSFSSGKPPRLRKGEIHRD